MGVWSETRKKWARQGFHEGQIMILEGQWERKRTLAKAGKAGMPQGRRKRCEMRLQGVARNQEKIRSAESRGNI